MYQSFQTKRLKGKDLELDYLLQGLHNYNVITGKTEISEEQSLKPYIKKNYVKDIQINTNVDRNNISMKNENKEENSNENESDTECDIQDMFGFSSIESNNEKNKINEPIKNDSGGGSLLSKLNLPKLNEEKYKNSLIESEPVIYPEKPIYISSVINEKKRKHDDLEVKKVWHPKNKKFSYLETSDLITTQCSICKKTGHMPYDCKYNQNTVLHPKLKNMYKKCDQLKNKTDIYCSECSSKFNLVQCLDCDTVWCDDKFHLINHLKSNPSHTTLFSYKLRKLIKCSNPTCKKTNIYKLIGCKYCFENIREKYYNFYTASWKSKGLHFVTKAITCQNHFQWHLSNCLYSELSETIVCRDRIEKHLYDDGQLNEYLF